MPANNVLTSGKVQVAAGSKVRLPMDFGNTPQLVAGAAVVNGALVLACAITAKTVTCTGTGAPTISGIQLDYPYQVSAVFDCPTAGQFTVVFTITLNDPDGTKVSRSAPLEVK